MEEQYSFIPPSSTESPSIIIRQQPLHARTAGLSDKSVDRRPIDPIPIVQIASNSASKSYLHNPFFFVYASLISTTSENEITSIPDSPNIKPLAGSVASALHRLKDLDNSYKGFFVFPDISVRIEGQFRLKFTLFEIIPTESPSRVVRHASIISSVFSVLPPKQFPGMLESSALAKSFADQGLKIRVRKDSFPSIQISNIFEPPKKFLKRTAEAQHEQTEHPSSRSNNISVNTRDAQLNHDKSTPSTTPTSTQSAQYVQKQPNSQTFNPAKPPMHPYAQYPRQMPPYQNSQFNPYQQQPYNQRSQFQQYPYPPQNYPHPYPPPHLSQMHPPHPSQQQPMHPSQHQQMHPSQQQMQRPMHPSQPQQQQLPPPQQMQMQMNPDHHQNHYPPQYPQHQNYPQPPPYYRQPPYPQTQYDPSVPPQQSQQPPQSHPMYAQYYPPNNHQGYPPYPMNYQQQPPPQMNQAPPTMNQSPRINQQPPQMNQQPPHQEQDQQQSIPSSAQSTPSQSYQYQ